jgi:hypothetical protein
MGVTWAAEATNSPAVSASVQQTLTLLSGPPPITIGLADYTYVDSLRQEFAEGEPFVGGPNRRWRRWKQLLPDRPDIWNELMRRRWRDQKLDPDFDYPQSPPPSAAQEAQLSVTLAEMWPLGCLEPELHPVITI